jgi:hypothetical protein
MVRNGFPPHEYRFMSLFAAAKATSRPIGMPPFEALGSDRYYCLALNGLGRKLEEYLDGRDDFFIGYSANDGLRQHLKQILRLTTALSKKIENHVHMVALYTTWYNFAGSIQRFARPPLCLQP